MKTKSKQLHITTGTKAALAAMGNMYETEDNSDFPTRVIVHRCGFISFSSLLILFTVVYSALFLAIFIVFLAFFFLAFCPRTLEIEAL